MSAGAWGANQLLLRSPGPRGPIAIACPDSTPNQSLRFGGFGVFFLRSLVRAGRLGELALRARDTIRSSPRRLVVWATGGEDETVFPWPRFLFSVLQWPTASRPFVGRVFRNSNPPLDRTGEKDYFGAMKESEMFVSVEREMPSGQISVAEAAIRLGLDAFTVYSFIQRDRLSPILDDDGEYVVSEQEVAALAQPKKE